MNSSSVRVRFAPSPTGHLHIGGVRTALFNWLFARNRGGKFILRIEDTDKERSTQESLDDILNSLKWMGIDWDEGPLFQSKRLAVYTDYIDKLLKKGIAYKGRKQEGKGDAVVFKSTNEKIVIYDIVHNKIEFDSGLIDDFIIMKSDGMPTYNFACVVDDALMNITHVIRGDDHISNTPRQVMLYRALGFGEPKFAHVPMILGPDGSRLSKRHGATSTGEYRRQGVLAPALLNFLALLGWSPGKNKELLDLNELIKSFSLKRITGKSAVFNVEKLIWMNSVYISRLSDKEMVSLCRPFLEKAGFLDAEDKINRLPKIIPLFKKRIKLISDIVDSAGYFFKEKIEYTPEARAKLNNKELLKNIKNKAMDINPFNLQNIEVSLRQIVDELSISPRDLMQTIRAAVTGRTVTAGIFETMSGMGKELFLSHLEQAINLIV